MLLRPPSFVLSHPLYSVLCPPPAMSSCHGECQHTIESASSVWSHTDLYTLTCTRYGELQLSLGTRGTIESARFGWARTGLHTIENARAVWATRACTPLNCQSGHAGACTLSRPTCQVTLARGPAHQGELQEISGGSM